MAKCSQLTSLASKGLKRKLDGMIRHDKRADMKPCMRSTIKRYTRPGGVYTK